MKLHETWTMHYACKYYVSHIPKYQTETWFTLVHTICLSQELYTDRMSVFCARDKICTVQRLSKQLTYACMTLLQMVGYSTIPVKIGNNFFNQFLCQEIGDNKHSTQSSDKFSPVFQVVKLHAYRPSQTLYLTFVFTTLWFDNKSWETGAHLTINWGLRDEQLTNSCRYTTRDPSYLFKTWDGWTT